MAVVSLTEQLIDIRKYYRKQLISENIRKGEMNCFLQLQPTEESYVYTVRITYKLSDHFPKAWLIEPELAKYNGKYPKHIYKGYEDEKGHPRICVYYPGYCEWTPYMLISKSFIPWILTWLNAYEFWQITGKWFYPESPHATGTKKDEKYRV